MRSRVTSLLFILEEWVPWDDIVVSAGKLRKLWDSRSELRSSQRERRLERTVLRPALLPIKTAQFTQCSCKGTEFLFNNLFINFAFIYFIIFVTSHYITLHPSAWGRKLKREYDSIASFLCSYARYSTCFASVVSRPPCHSDTLNSVPHKRCSFPKNSAWKWIKLVHLVFRVFANYSLTKRPVNQHLLHRWSGNLSTSNLCTPETRGRAPT